MPKSRFFRVATEGATTDGRKIERQWLTDMAQTYDPATYAARVNMEHIRGITAEPPFQALGDVLSLKTDTVSLTVGGKVEKRLALFAEIDALDPLVAMNKAGQKLYTSIEVNPNFADTGKAYLVGLAVTDSPASLGTEMLQFCAAKGDASPLAHRKQDPANLFTAAAETTLEFEDGTTALQPDDDAGAAKTLLGIFQKLLGFKEEEQQKAATTITLDGTAIPAAQQAVIAAAMEKIGAKAEFTSAAPAKPAGADTAPAFSLSSLLADPALLAIGTGLLDKAQKAFATLEATAKAQAATDAALKELTGKLEKTAPGQFNQRKPATGTPNVELTDC